MVDLVDVGAGVAGALGFGGSKGLGFRKRGQARLVEQMQNANTKLAPWHRRGDKAYTPYRKGIENKATFAMPGKFRPGQTGMPGEFESAGVPGRFRFNLEEDPGYQFARDEALRATGRAMSAGGYNQSGNLLNALSDRAASVASQHANDAFQRQAGAYGLNMNRANALQGRRMDQFNANMGRSNQLFNQRMATHGANMDRSNVLYGRDQNRLNRLQQLVGMGYDAASQRAANNMTAGTQMAAIWTGAAPAAQQNRQFQLQTLNNAIQGGLRNHLLQQYIDKQPAGVTPQQMTYLQNPYRGPR